MSHGKGRIVLKFGTGVLAKPGGGALDVKQFRRFADEISSLVLAGHPCVLVSSAAIAAGVSVLGLKARPTDLHGKQACAAVGQPELMRLYTESFRRHGLKVAQLLLTHGDIDSRTRRANARNTLERLLESGRIVPIINENDSVAVEEVRFGDNDRLSAEVALLVRASRLLLLTNASGLNDHSGLRLKIVRDMEKAFSYVRPEKGEYSVGGMHTKLEAVQIAVNAGIPATILDGSAPGQIVLGAAGADAGTRFVVNKVSGKKPETRVDSRKPSRLRS
ncbi:MAG: glutamate 5-kinase [Terrimicrobiaceae bacterium]